MDKNYSRSLYNLYKEGRKFCDKYDKVMDYLAEDESGLEANPVRTFPSGAISLSYGRTNIRDFETDEELRNAYTQLRDFRQSWRDQVLEILDQLPQISFRLRFEESRDDLNNATMKYATSFISLTDDLEETINYYCALEDEVDELYGIINDYEEMLFQNKASSTTSKQAESPKSEVLYRLTYDKMSGKLYINDKEVYKCNLDSKLDQALTKAMQHPCRSINITGNLAPSISNIKIPKELRNLFFRTGKGSFMISPTITLDDLKMHNLNQADIDLEIQNH